MNKIVPSLWFDTQAKAAAEFYAETFPHSRVTSHHVLKNTPSGDCDVMEFTVGGQDFMAISAGPIFKMNQSVSYFVNFDPSTDDAAEAHLRELWNKLTPGGTVNMELQTYPYSKLYGWVVDTFGVGWQLMLTNPEGEPRPFITPSLLFGGPRENQAEAAIEFYTSVFKNAKTGTLARYPQATGPAKAGSLMYADFQLEGQWLAAMDSGVEQNFTFNEATSFTINCDTQEEIDFYWEKLSAVPESEQCGWLKDKFGFSWQVVPGKLQKLMAQGTPEQTTRVTQAFLKMKKFDIAALETAYRGDDA